MYFWVLLETVLLFYQLRIYSVKFQELLMCALFHNPPFLHIKVICFCNISYGKFSSQKIVHQSQKCNPNFWSLKDGEQWSTQYDLSSIPVSRTHNHKYWDFLFVSSLVYCFFSSTWSACCTSFSLSASKALVAVKRWILWILENENKNKLKETFIKNQNFWIF